MPDDIPPDGLDVTIRLNPSPDGDGRMLSAQTDRAYECPNDEALSGVFELLLGRQRAEYDRYERWLERI